LKWSTLLPVVLCVACVTKTGDDENGDDVDVYDETPGGGGEDGGAGGEGSGDDGTGDDGGDDGTGDDGGGDDGGDDGTDSGDIPDTPVWGRMAIIETDLDGCSYDYLMSGDLFDCEDCDLGFRVDVEFQGTDCGGSSGSAYDAGLIIYDGVLFFYGTSEIGPVERSYEGYLRWEVEQYTSVGRWQTHTGYLFY